MAAASVAASADRLGELLLAEGLITREQLDRAIREQQEHGTRLGYNLIKQGAIKETELTRMLGRQYRMPAVDLSRFEMDPKIAKLIPAELAMKHQVLPLRREG